MFHNLQAGHVADTAEQTASESEQERESLKEQVSRLQGQLEHMQKTHEGQVADNSQLSRY